MAPDKCTFNLEDDEALAERVSRMEPGEKLCLTKLELSLDESDGKLATFSLAGDINVDPKYKDPDMKGEDSDDDDEPMAVKWKKDQDKEAPEAEEA